jgi:hypothetical protein
MTRGPVKVVCPWVSVPAADTPRALGHSMSVPVATVICGFASMAESMDVTCARWMRMCVSTARDGHGVAEPAFVFLAGCAICVVWSAEDAVRRMQVRGVLERGRHRDVQRTH